MIDRIDRLDRLLGRAELAFCVVCLVVIVASTAAGVFFRYVLHTPLMWSNDTGALALVWLTFVGAAAVFKEGGHVAITGLVEKLPARWQRAVALASAALIGVTVLVTGWYAVLAAGVQWPQKIVALDLSRGFYSVPIVWAAVSMAVTALVAAAKAAAGLGADGGRAGRS